MDYEDKITKNHYKRLNNYRKSKEYQESPECYEKIEGEFPSMLNDPWEINEEIYWYFLEMLPPIDQTSRGFYMSERTFEDITAHFFRKGGKYFCEHARLSGRKAA